MNSLRIHRLLPASVANGPGVRAVLWIQGCSLSCPHCFNPETHSFSEGEQIAVDRLADQIFELASNVQGLTVTGGEPLQQADPLVELLESVRASTSLSIVLFSGFTWNELERHDKWPRISSAVDVVIAGRYEHTQRVADGLIGSANKTTHFLTDRYSESDLEGVPVSEVIIESDGSLSISGIEPLRW